MLGLSLEELNNMDYGEFILIVESSLAYEDDKMEELADTLLPFMAQYTSMLMMSSGNMGKRFDPKQTAKQLYPKDEVWGEEFTDSTQSTDYVSNKEKLLSEFNLDDKDFK